jgi:hypothetical protein
MSHLFKSSASKWGLLVTAVIALTLLVLSLSALPSAAAPLPQGTIHKVYISNVSDKGFVASWTTGAPVTSAVNYGPTSALGFTKADSLNPTATTMHYVQITGLSASTTYTFETVSGPISSGAIYTVTTGPSLGSSPQGTVDGFVYSSGSPMANVIVYFLGIRAGGNSALASARTESDGYYTYNVGNLRTADLKFVFNPLAGSETVSVTAQGGSLGITQTAIAVPDPYAALDLYLNGTPNAITLRSLTSRTESSVWMPVGLAFLAAATTIMVVRKRRG